MPYKRIGRKVYTKKTGKWKLKQTAKSVVNAEKTIRLLDYLEGQEYKK